MSHGVRVEHDGAAPERTKESIPPLQSDHTGPNS